MASCQLRFENLRRELRLTVISYGTEIIKVGETTDLIVLCKRRILKCVGVGGRRGCGGVG